MLIDLHGIVIACESPDEIIQQKWMESFSSRLRLSNHTPDIAFSIKLVPAVPAPLAAPPIFKQGSLLSVFASDSTTLIHFPRFGQLQIDLKRDEVRGEIVEAALHTYGVFEDVVAMGLTALLRRRHWFLIHAFAAAFDQCAILLVGDIGSGKTTTGISLLRAGWQLLSNDSPLLARGKGQGTRDEIVAMAYPGLLSAYPDTLKRFPELSRLTLPLAPSPLPRTKITFAAESVYPDVWIESAPVSAIVFPHVAHLAEHQVTRLSEPEALRRLLPNAIDRWDTAMIPEHLQLLNALVTQAPAYQIELGEQTDSLPRLMQGLL